MRRSLAALQGQRINLFATVRKISSKGDVLLRDLIYPGGYSQHAWIPARHWAARIPGSDDRVELTARVVPYWRENGQKDFGLIEVREAAP